VNNNAIRKEGIQCDMEKELKEFVRKVVSVYTPAQRKTFDAE
jgi:hypothetical protein